MGLRETVFFSSSVENLNKTLFYIVERDNN